MKDSIISLFIFLLVFIAVLSVFTGFYFLYSVVVPGGKGLIFSNPFMQGFFAGLVTGLLFALFHAVHFPGRFIATYCTLTLVVFLILSFVFPVVLKVPTPSLLDFSPLKQGQFLTLADESKIYQPDNIPQAAQGQFYRKILVIPTQNKPMEILTDGQFDPLNKRFLLSPTIPNPIPLKDITPEQEYFGFPDMIKSFQMDFFKIYTELKITLDSDQIRFFCITACLSILFMGLLFFFSLKTWPLIQWVFVLIVLRLMIAYAALCLWDIPAMVEPWFSPASSGFYKLWTPVFLLGLAGSVLFFMSLLTKPHRKSIE